MKIKEKNSKITNSQNSKKILFRKQLLPFVLIISLLGLIVLVQIRNLTQSVDELSLYQELQLRTTSQIINRYKQARDKAEIENLAIQKELDEKNTELAKVSQELQDITKELTDKEVEVKNLQIKIKNQGNQLSANASELQRLRTRPPLFSFRNQSSLADVESKQAQVKEVVTNAYDVINDLYGLPYLLHSVTITFVDQFTIEGASGEILVKNSSEGIEVDVRLKDFNKDNFADVSSVIHEVIHSFHGIAVFDTTVFEEGIVVAATDVVLEKLMAQGKIPQFNQLYINISQSTYDSWNTTYTIPHDYQQFYSSDNVDKYYQLAGFAWLNLYKENSQFFSQFNEKYYQHIQEGEQASDELIKSIIKEIMTSVKNQPIDQYLQNQSAFNPV